MFIILAAGCAYATLPAPSRLLIDLQTGTNTSSSSSVTVAASSTPLFSFLPESEDAPAHGSIMSSYRIVISHAISEAVAWDSTKVAASDAIGIRCASPLIAGTYKYTAMWWDTTGRVSPPTSTFFEVGPSAEMWASSGSPWFGASDQRELRFFFNTSRNDRLVRLFVASPGGVVVFLDGKTIGDAAGVSAWTAFDKRVIYETRALETEALARGADRASTTQQHTIVLSLGSGFYSKPVGGAPHPACRFMLLLTDATGEARFLGATGISRVQGRPGAVAEDSVTLGTSIDWRVTPGVGWAEAVPMSVPAAPAGVITPLTVPAATTRCEVRPTAVTALGNDTWHYVLPVNLVGIVQIEASAYAGPGVLTVQHCERLHLKTAAPTCVALAGLEAGVIDTHTLAAGAGTTSLVPRFTWHGFQHVFVRASGGATFSGARDALRGCWATANLAPAASISFASDGGGATLATLQSMVYSSQLSNMAAYIPTDCPTREKHGWLGDAQVTFEEAAYNLWAPTVHALFLELIRDQQLLPPTSSSSSSLSAAAAAAAGGGGGPSGGAYAGFVPSVVPSVRKMQLPGDLSWTAAYPLIARWHLRYYGTIDLVRDHWPSLKRWADGAERVAKGNRTDGLPDFFVWGDWCCVEGREECTPGTGPQAAASNWLLAVRAMVEMAEAIGEAADAKRYEQVLAAGQTAYDARYYNASVGGWVGARPELEHQTLASLALNALDGAAGGEVPARRSATAALLATDVAAQGHHLTTGSAGQKWLLRTLSSLGASQHDDAIRLATQTTEPSWGFWASSGATTCWENWSGVADPSHPPEPTHNHIFLCGGLGEWLHRSLGGISPAADGWAKVSIAPRVSKSLGPSAVNASVLTIRGRVESRWVRGGGDGTGGSGKAAATTATTALIRLQVRVPTSVGATIRVPLAERDVASVEIRAASAKSGGETRIIWPRSGSSGAKEEQVATGGALLVTGVDGDGVLVSVPSGVHEFVVRERVES